MVTFFFFKQKTAYEMRISDWSSDVCSSDLVGKHDGTARCSSYQTLDFAWIDNKFADCGFGGGFAAPCRGGRIRLMRHRGRATFEQSSAARCSTVQRGSLQIGRASCRERVCQYV